MSFAAIIFDVDGVIADSEVHANLALAECLTLIGLPTTPLLFRCRIEQKRGRSRRPFFICMFVNQLGAGKTSKTIATAHQATD